MKKCLALLAAFICVFGLTACGNEKEPTAFEERKKEMAVMYATEGIVPIVDAMREDSMLEIYSEYTAEEVAADVSYRCSLNVDGNAFKGALESFTNAHKEIGDIVEIGEATAKIDGTQIIVMVEVKGSKKDAEAEVIFSNDGFLKLKSASLNAKSTMADSMKKAALNTLLGMGTVFTVLILIALIIACFGVIPKIQAAFDEKKNAKQAEKTVGIDNAVAQITGLEEKASAGEDLELVAVIAAAIAASEGAASTDGFVVRSIRRRRAY